MIKDESEKIESRRTSVSTDKDDSSRRSSVAKDEKPGSRRESVAEKLAKKVRLTPNWYSISKIYVL